MTKEEIAKILRQIGVEDHIPAIIRLYDKALSAQKQDLLKKIKGINVGTLGGSIIISRKDVKQLLK